MPDLSSPLDDSAAPTSAASASAAPAGRARRQWQQPLGEIHNKLGNIVGAGSLAFSFDCNDQDFVFALTSRWPLGTDFTHSLYETDTLKLADALNGLVRLYAIETGQERLHVLLEARRGKPELPGWWRGSDGNAPVLFATYAFDTNFAQVGLFGDLNDAYAEMDLLNQPHRLLVAIGPATPVMVDADGGEIELDGDEERLLSLKRWNQRLALQINQLLAATFGGGETEVEAVVEALSKVRDLSSRLAVQLIEREGRLRRRAARRDDLTDELYDSMRPRAGKRAGPHLHTQVDPGADAKSRIGAETKSRIGADSETRLGETLAGLQNALKSEGLTNAMNPAVRADLRKSLDTLVATNVVATNVVAAPKPQAGQPAKQPKPVKPEAASLAKSAPKPGAAMVVLLCLCAFGAAARDASHGGGSFGLAPYRDTMRYYEYADNTDPRLSSGGNGTVTPHRRAVKKKPPKDDSYKPAQVPAAPAVSESAIPSPPGKWDENKNNCAGRAAHTARRRYGNVPIEVFSDGQEGAAFIGGKRYTYRCSGDPQTGLLVFRPDQASQP